MQSLLIAASSLLAFVAYIVYIIAILKGKAKPHRTSSFVVLFIGCVTIASLFAQSNTVAIWLSGVFTICSLAIFFLSLQFGMGGWGKTDITCLLLAFAGIIVWKMTANPLYALLFSIGADFAGQIPKLIKTFRFPKTEVWTFYAIGTVACVLNILAIQKWTLEEVVFPFYIIAVNLLLIFLIIRTNVSITQRRSKKK